MGACGKTMLRLGAFVLTLAVLSVLEMTFLGLEEATDSSGSLKELEAHLRSLRERREKESSSVADGTARTPPPTVDEIEEEIKRLDVVISIARASRLGEGGLASSPKSPCRKVEEEDDDDEEEEEGDRLPPCGDDSNHEDEADFVDDDPFAAARSVAAGANDWLKADEFFVQEDDYMDPGRNEALSGMLHNSIMGIKPLGDLVKEWSEEAKEVSSGASFNGLWSAVAEGEKQNVLYSESHELVEDQSKAKGGSKTVGDASDALIRADDIDFDRPMSQRVVDPAFIEWRENFRKTSLTYSRVSKKGDLEHWLKQMGFKQATRSSKKTPLVISYDGETCPSWPKNSKHLSFCTQYVLSFREQQQYQLLKALEESARGKETKLKVKKFFPATWRLYKEADRRQLKIRLNFESTKADASTQMKTYVIKYTYSHFAGDPSITTKLWDKIKKSDSSVKERDNEAKNKKIVQVWINNPYLFEGRKFVIRTWAVIASRKPLIAYYHDGYLMRSVTPYTPFKKRDSSYRKSAYFTNQQSGVKKSLLRSSNLYASMEDFQEYLNENSLETPGFVDEWLRPKIKARMVYTLSAMTNIIKDTVDYEALKRPSKLPPNIGVVQAVCFDFIVSDTKHVWMVGASTSQCNVNVGGDNFRPSWKVRLRDTVAKGMIHLNEEILWRRSSGKPVSSAFFFTDLGANLLVDETRPGYLFSETVDGYENSAPNNDAASSEQAGDDSEEEEEEEEGGN